MCILATRAPTSYLTIPALEELDNLTSLFDSASSSACRPASDLLVRIFSSFLFFVFWCQRSKCYVLQNSVQTLRQQAHEVIGSPHTRYYHEDEDTFTPTELDRLNGKTYLFADDHSLLSSSSSLASSSSTNLSAVCRSRATSVTMSDSAETHPPAFYMTDHLHPTLAQDLEEFRMRSSTTTTTSFSPMTFHDPISSSSSDHSPPSPPPPPSSSSQTTRHTTTIPETSKLVLQPILMTVPSSPPPPHMHFFHQPYHHGMSSYGSGFGGGYTGHYGAVPNIVLDPVWHGLAEQLGFWTLKPSFFFKKGEAGGSLQKPWLF